MQPTDLIEAFSDMEDAEMYSGWEILAAEEFVRFDLWWSRYKTEWMFRHLEEDRHDFTYVPPVYAFEVHLQTECKIHQEYRSFSFLLRLFNSKPFIETRYHYRFPKNEKIF